MYWYGKEFIYFDIETQGFATEDDFICSLVYIPFENGSQSKAEMTIEGLYNFFKNIDKEDYIIVTYNGENYQSGFDFPFLRTQFAFKGFEWVFKGWEHLDVYPLIKKYFNTTRYYEKLPSKSSLKKADLEKLAKSNGIDYTTINDTHENLTGLKKIDWLDYKTIETKDKNSLQDVYKLFFDPDEEEIYISGGEMPEADIGTVIEHCNRDVMRLCKVTELLFNYIPSWEIERNINKL